MWKDLRRWLTTGTERTLSLSLLVRQWGGRMTPAEGKSRSGVHAVYQGRSLHQSGWQSAAACIPHSSHPSAWDLAQLNNKRLPEDEHDTEKSVSRAAPHGPSLCPDVHAEFPVFDFAALGNLIWTTEQWGDDVHMNDKKKKKRKKICSVFHYVRIHVDLSSPSCWRMQACLSHTAVTWGFNVAYVHLYNQASCQMGQLSTRTSVAMGGTLPGLWATRAWPNNPNT